MRWTPPISTASQCAKVGFLNNHLTIEEVRMNITTIGIDLAKTSFSLVGADKYGNSTRPGLPIRKNPLVKSSFFILCKLIVKINKSCTKK